MTKSFSRQLFEHRRAIFMAVVMAAVLCTPLAVLASETGDTLAWNAGVYRLVNVLSGRTALLVSMIGLFFAGGMLIFGGDLGGFGRMIMMVVLVGSLLGALSSLASRFITVEGFMLLM